MGLVIDPGEGLDRALIEQLAPAQLTVMSVEPGGVGRPFRDEALLALAEAAELRARGIVQRVEADGAVGPDTVARLVSAGAANSSWAARSSRDAARTATVWTNWPWRSRPSRPPDLGHPLIPDRSSPTDKIKDRCS